MSLAFAAQQLKYITIISELVIPIKQKHFISFLHPPEKRKIEITVLLKIPNDTDIFSGKIQWTYKFICFRISLFGASASPLKMI